MVKIPLRIMFLALIVFNTPYLLFAQFQYNDFKSMSQKINTLSKKYPGVCSIKSLVKTSGGKDIWVMTIGTGTPDDKPGIAVLGGLEGNQLLGKELALGFAEELLNDSDRPVFLMLSNMKDQLMQDQPMMTGIFQPVKIRTKILIMMV